MSAAIATATDWHRTCFVGAATGFVELVRQVGEGWERPALGSWDVRGLVGHASRSFTALTTYLPAAPPGAPVEVDGPIPYYLAALGDRDDPGERQRRDTAIAERGREAGTALGSDPVRAVTELARDALELVERTEGSALVATPVGIMALSGYLPTRTFELTVHGLDLAAALTLPLPSVLGPAITYCCELAGQLAGQRPNAPELLLVMTGRVAGVPSVL